MNGIIWQPRAHKQLKKLGNQQVQKRILAAVAGLSNFPAVSGVKPLNNHQYGYRLRVGNYRVLFDVYTAIEVISIEEEKKEMNAPTEYQTIYHDGQPAFVLVPVEDFEKMRAQLREPLHEGIPQAIVEANVIHGVSMIRAWREHLGLTQAEVAARANMKQPALARLERGEGKPRKTTLAKLAEAMGLTIMQLEE